MLQVSWHRWDCIRNCVTNIVSKFRIVQLQTKHLYSSSFLRKTNPIKLNTSKQIDLKLTSNSLHHLTHARTKFFSKLKTEDTTKGVTSIRNGPTRALFISRQRSLLPCNWWSRPFTSAIVETKHSADVHEPSVENILQHSILIHSVASILLLVFIVLFATALFAFSLILFS